MDVERDLILDPLTIEEIKELAALAGGIEPLLSKKSPKYKEYQERVAAPEDWLPLMAEEPRLLKRPIVVRDGQIYIGFDQKAWSEILPGQP